MAKSSNYYQIAGIKDVAEFYRERFSTGGVFDARYFDAIYRFNINYARTMWVYDNVRRSSSVLDLGCGEGVLALLKRKDVHLTGIDLSRHLVEAAHSNGYDHTLVSDLTNLPFPDNYFDYVVSLDVMGHIAADEKDAVLMEIKRVLKTDGVTLHGIEVLNRELHPDYDSMRQEELANFVRVDGHIGLEDEQDTAERFKRIFSFVRAEPRYSVALSCAEFIKQYEEYGAPFDKDFIDYLSRLSFTERNAFDMAMGYVFGKISDLNIQLPNGGLYLLLKAGNCPLGPFYNEHRDRKDLFLADADSEEVGPTFLDRSSRALFDNGWYAANNLPPIARWMSGRGRIRFQAGSFSRLRFDVTTHMPDVASKPLAVEVCCNNVPLARFDLTDHSWQKIETQILEAITRDTTRFELDFSCDRTWQPSKVSSDTRDDRELSIAVCNIEIL